MRRDPRSGVVYIRCKIPLPLRPAFNSGEFHKLPLETSDAGVAAKRFAIANGKYEGKVQVFGDALPLRRVRSCTTITAGLWFRLDESRGSRQ